MTEPFFSYSVGKFALEKFVFTSVWKIFLISALGSKHQPVMSLGLWIPESLRPNHFQKSGSFFRNKTDLIYFIQNVPLYWCFIRKILHSELYLCIPSQFFCLNDALIVHLRHHWTKMFLNFYFVSMYQPLSYRKNYLITFIACKPHMMHVL